MNATGILSFTRKFMIDVGNANTWVAYLQTHDLLGRDEVPTVSVLSGGVSSNTILVRRTTGESYVIKQALPKLRVAVEWRSDPRRVHNEALGMKWLTRFCPMGSIPELVFEDHEHGLVVMKAVPDPHDNWKDLLLAGEIDFNLVIQFADTLATIHRESFLQRGIVEPVFKDRTFFETLRLEPYYRYSAELVPQSRVFFAGLISETLNTRLCLVHGDYSPKNILVFRGQMVLLDHEVIHFGDPAFDVGFAMAHFLSKAHHFPERRAVFIQAAILFAERYRCGLQDLEWRNLAEERAVKHTVGCLLARVAGRSTLEYLRPSERKKQKDIAVAMMSEPAAHLSDAIRELYRRLDCR